MGGGGSVSAPILPQATENYPAYKAGEIGESMWNMTAPTRASLLDIYKQFLDPAGGYNVSNLPGYSANYNLARGQTEDAYNAARQNIMSTMPRGGALYGGLNALEMDRAKSLGNTSAQLTSAFTKDLMDKAYGTGFTVGPQTALAGLGIHAGDTRSGMNAQLAASLQAQQMMRQQETAQNQGKGSGMGLLGAGLGSILGMGMAPMTGGTSLFGSAMSGLGSGKGTGGTTSGLGGYSGIRNNFLFDTYRGQ